MNFSIKSYTKVTQKSNKNTNNIIFLLIFFFFDRLLKYKYLIINILFFNVRF